jgi:ribonuclease P/MRP protein subunit RPP1
MAFYDLHVHTDLSIGEHSLEEMVLFARRLGIHGIGVVQYFPDIADVPDFEGVDTVECVMLKPRSAEELNEMAQAARSKCEILMVHGGDYDINRAACENAMVDVLCHPELGRKDSGLDHICVKAASDNHVAIEMNFREILESSKKSRTYVLSAMKKNVMLAKKYGCPIVCASGAVSKWDMRSCRELSAIANLLGLDVGYAIDTTSVIPEAIVRKNREKLAGGSWQGVKTVK